MAKQATAMVKWDEELAREAELAAGMEASTAAGQFFSLKNGVLSWNDAPLPNNQMGAIILDAVLENVMYEGKYDPDEPAGPVCFAFGRDDKTMSPHKVAVEAGTAMEGPCQTCPKNEWGSADIGKGKACRNTRRLALIPAGTFNQNGKFEPFEEEEHFETTPLGYMKLPVTSVKGYGSFVTQVAGTLKIPTWALMTKVKVAQDSKTQFKVTFEPISKVPNHLIGILKKRNEDAKALIEFPYTPREEAPKRGAKPTRKGRKY
jgi:hypothetical protein